MFQAKKWGWKQIAARLLLVPVLSGTTAGLAHAQTPGGAARGTMPGGPAEDQAKGIMLQAEQSLRAGDLSRARSQLNLVKGMRGALPPAEIKRFEDLQAALAQAETGMAPPTVRASNAPPSANSAMPAPTKPGVSPQMLLKEGRKALAAGQFDTAQDLARQAEATNPNGKWGLFDDTPNALLKDVQAARGKAEKTQADTLVKQAKGLLTKPAANEAERMANLDQALQMARQADKLHGPYSVWDNGDRPDKLVKDIETARGKVRMNPVPMPPGGNDVAKTTEPPKATGPTQPFASTLPAGGPNTGAKPALNPAGANTPMANAGQPAVGGAKPPTPGAMPSVGPVAPVKPADLVASKPTDPVKPGTMPKPADLTPKPADPVATKPATPPAPAVDPKKVAATKLLAEGQQLANKGDFAGAKAKYTEADKIGATFAVTEVSPSFALQELNARGAASMDRLVKDADALTKKKDYAKAEAALTAASEIANALGLVARPVEEAKTALRTASAGKAGGPPPVGLAPAGGPEVLVPAMPSVASLPTTPTMPMMPAAPTAPPGVGMPKPAAPVAVAPAPAPAGGVTGRQMLAQAEMEFAKGDYDIARKLALQAHNQGGSQDEARRLLNQIDAEVFAGKQRTAVKSYEAAAQAFEAKDYTHASNVLGLIDPNLLPPDLKEKRDSLMAMCKAEAVKAATPPAELVAIGGAQPPAASPATPAPTPPAVPSTPLTPIVPPPSATGGELQPKPIDVPPVVSQPVVPPALPATPPVATQPTAPATPNVNPIPTAPPGTARVNDPKAGPDDLATQADALRKVQFQKLRSDGLKIQADAQAAFGRGETDLAIQMMVDYSNRVRAANLEPASVALLLRPIDSRLEMFKIMKGQADALAREKTEKQQSRELIAGRGAAEEQRKAEVQKLVRRYHALVQQSDYAEAEKVAMQAKQLSPDDPAIEALALVAKMTRRQKDAEKLKTDKEKFVLASLNGAEQIGPYVDTNDPVAVKLDAMNRSRRRGSLDDAYLKTRTPAEFEIELKLDKPITIEFNQTPLEWAVENLRSLTGLPLVFDYPSLEGEGLSPAKPITVKPGVPVSARNVLHIVLEQAGMSYVVENDVVKVTTTKKAKGRLYTKVFSVADLVTPVPNFAMPDYANFDKMLNKNALNSGNVSLQGMTGGSPSPLAPSNGLGGGVPAGLQASSPGIAGGMTFGGSGTLQNQSGGPNPLSASASLAPERNTKHEQLMKLITGMVRPYSWDGMGGAGKVEYFDLGSALVVNQTADVIKEVADLLEALRRLQDLAIAVEIRIVSLSETFFERMGVDFSMNIKTHTSKIEPSFNSGIFRPEPFINDNNYKGYVLGLTPAGTYTPDLDVPIRATSFNYAIPGFGGYPQSPGNNGGVSLGLAFLNDIQVFMFMEAAQGDRRVNVMQAPKLTLFNGQTSTLTITDTQFVVTNVTVVSVNGQIVFIPTNTPLPGPGGLAGGGAFNIAIQGVVSADRRFVRLNLPVTLAAQTGATVPLFPITTFITPVFEGGSQGVPIPFTQFLQQPAFTTLTVATTVVCPDGGTVLLGGLKALSEGRNEFGPPFLSKIPYLNRLFKNVGIGRQTSHIMIMVTPRIIINSEEEIFQTEGRPPFGGGQ